MWPHSRHVDCVSCPIMEPSNQWYCSSTQPEILSTFYGMLLTASRIPAIAECPCMHKSAASLCKSTGDVTVKGLRVLRWRGYADKVGWTESCVCWLCVNSADIWTNGLCEVYSCPGMQQVHAAARSRCRFSPGCAMHLCCIAAISRWQQRTWLLTVHLSSTFGPRPQASRCSALQLRLWRLRSLRRHHTSTHVLFLWLETQHPTKAGTCTKDGGHTRLSSSEPSASSPPTCPTAAEPAAAP